MKKKGKQEDAYTKIQTHSPEEGHPSPKVLGKYYFSQKPLTGQLSTAHGYPSASPTKRDNTPFKKTARSEAVVAEVPASRSGRERRHTPLRGVAPFRGPAPIPTSLFLSSPQCISYSQFNVKMFFLCLMHSQQTNKIQNRDVPPSFHRNDFSTCFSSF